LILEKIAILGQPPRGLEKVNYLEPISISPLLFEYP